MNDERVLTSASPRLYSQEAVETREEKDRRYDQGAPIRSLSPS